MRTKELIAKEKIFDAMAELRQGTLSAEHTINCGDIVAYVTDSDGSRVPVIATADES